MSYLSSTGEVASLTARANEVFLGIRVASTSSTLMPEALSEVVTLSSNIAAPSAFDFGVRIYSTVSENIGYSLF